MPTLLVTGITHTQAGRPKIQCGKDAYLVGNGVDVPPVGSTIEANTSSSDFTPPGKSTPVTTWWLNDWKLAGEQPPVTETKAILAEAAKATVTREHFQMLEAKGRFISNLVGSAIASGKCAAPTDIAGWTVSALKAADLVFDDKAQA